MEPKRQLSRDRSSLAPAASTGREIDVRRDRGIAGMTLIEALMATAILGLTLIGLMSGISFMRIQNRASSERMLASSIGSQILEMFKALPFTDIANSTAAAPIYLEGFGTATPDLAWYVPQAGQWQTLPVEDVNSTASGYPSVITDKLPEGQWQVQIQPLASNANVVQVTVTINWNLYAGASTPPYTYSISTMVDNTFPTL